MIATIAFYIFALSMIASAVMVVASRNPVHSVLFLISAFIGAAGLFVLMGAEYLAMLLVVVYVGAVAVLFLFVVMMLDVDFVELKQGFLQYLPFAVTLAAVMVIELIFVVTVWVFPTDTQLSQPVATVGSALAGENAPNNIEALGLILYTDYVHYFQIAGIILLVAMIGAIVLTFREREGIKTQDIAAQLGRTREEGVEVVSVETGQGI